MTCEDCYYFESCYRNFFESDLDFGLVITHLCDDFTVKGGDTFDRD